MKIIKIVKSALCMAIIINIGTASAYSPEETEKSCKKPRFTDFNLSEYKAPSNIETQPEAEFIIKVSPWADPSSIKLTAKKEPLAFTIQSTSTFHKITAKLPASLTGDYVRIDVSAKAVLGCDDKSGWLIKVANQ